jgi:anthranilate synthase/aminodeoxychorismate synthase-like glutamine amidotransferase
VVLLLDNYDSFTYNLYDYILQLGQQCTVVRNNEMSIEEIAALNFSSIVISPGPKTPKEAGITMQLIERFHQTRPILGICLGHQAIGQFFGAQLVKAAKPMHGKTSTISHNNHWLFKGIPTPFEVMRYHSLVIEENLPKYLHLLAQNYDRELMVIAHENLPIIGIQFHPESVLTEHGLQLLQNWFEGIDTKIDVSKIPVSEDTCR